VARPRSRRPATGAIGLALAALLSLGATASPRGAAAQDSSAPDAPAPGAPAGEARRVAGRVVRPGGDSVVAAPGTWVTIHRVGPDGAGPLDSTRTDAAGRYAFAYRTSGSERSVYFVSASYGGIAYFSPPLTARSVTGDDAEITVFDTTSAPVPITVRGRHLIVLAPRAGSDGRREVLEVYELSNDTTVTAISGAPGAPLGGARPTWAAVVPAGARDFHMQQGDVAPDAARLADGRVEVYAPLAPGLKQVSFSYTLAPQSFPLHAPLERPTSVLEVLVEGKGGEVGGARLREVSPVAQEGRNFRRFLAQDAPASAVATVSFPPVALATRRSLYVAVVVTLAGAAMLLALARAAGRGRRPASGGAGPVFAPAGAPAPGAPAGDPDRLAREIASLDAAFARQRGVSEEARATYQARREALKRDLTAALAAREGRG
jgi:hypothetical protein